MLSKEYLVTGVFQARNNQQLNIRFDSGIPTQCTQLRRRCFKEGVIRARHGLKGPINFYAVTQCNGHRLISISDGRQTRYYWLGLLRYSTYVVDKPSRDFETAWKNLYEALVLDSRTSAFHFYRVVWPFFVELLDYNKRGEYHAHLVGKWKGESVDVTLSVTEDTQPGMIDYVLYPGNKGGGCRLYKPVLHLALR
jgi:hypothetical protein